MWGKCSPIYKKQGWILLTPAQRTFFDALPKDRGDRSVTTSQLKISGSWVVIKLLFGIRPAGLRVIPDNFSVLDSSDSTIDFSRNRIEAHGVLLDLVLKGAYDRTGKRGVSAPR